MTDNNGGRQAPEGGLEQGVVRAALDTLESAVFVSDLATGQPIYTNKAAETLSFSSFQPPDDETDRFRKLVDGRWYRVMRRPMTGDGALLMTIATEIPHPPEEEEDHARVLSFLNESQKLAKIGSWELDLTTNRLFWTDEIYRMFDVDKGRFEATYEAFLAAIHPDDRNRVNDAYSASLRSKEPYGVTHRLLHPDGSISYVREECATIFEEGTGRPLRSIGTVQDVTDAMERQDALREAVAVAERSRLERERSISVIAYDVKEPVATLASYLDLLANDGSLPPGPIRDYLPVAQRTAQELALLLDSVIHASTLASGAYPFRLRFFDAGFVAFMVVTEFLSFAHDQGVTLTNLVPRRTRFYGDPARFQEVLENLAQNAITFTPRGGSVTVTLSSTLPNGISVVDTGVGMPQEMVDELFLFGARVVRSGADGQLGPAVNLPSNREMIERMGGTLTATADGDEGSIFTVTLPAVTPHVLLKAPREADEVRLSRILNEAGVRPIINETQEPLHLIVVLVTPDEEGLDRLRAIRMDHRFDDLPLIAVGPADSERERQAVAAGADLYLADPLTPWGLDEGIDRLLLA